MASHITCCCLFFVFFFPCHILTGPSVYALQVCCLLSAIPLNWSLQFDPKVVRTNHEQVNNIGQWVPIRFPCQWRVPGGHMQVSGQWAMSNCGQPKTEEGSSPLMSSSVARAMWLMLLNGMITSVLPQHKLTFSILCCAVEGPVQSCPHNTVCEQGMLCTQQYHLPSAPSIPADGTGPPGGKCPSLTRILSLSWLLLPWLASTQIRHWIQTRGGMLRSIMPITWLMVTFWLSALKGLNLSRLSHEFEREKNTNPHPGGNAKACEGLESVENQVSCCLSRSWVRLWFRRTRSMRWWFWRRQK